MGPILTRFKVRTLGPEALRLAAEALYALARRDFQPDLILGIRTGGYRVAALMGHEADGVMLLPVTCRRPGTARKSRSLFFRRGLKHLPYIVNDRLRVLEHLAMLARRGAAASGPRTLDPAEFEAVEAALKGGARRVLIVDDAVDSGSTLLAVGDRVRALAGPGVAVKTAAVTVTMPTPLIDPDYVLYRHELCRFPWSFDFRD